MRRAILRRLPVVVALCALPAAVQAAASPWVGDAHAQARLVSATEAVGSAQRLDAGIEIRLAPGWHAYWRAPGDAGIAPGVDWKGSHNLADATLAWPAPHRLSTQGLETAVYDGDVVLPVAATLAQPGQPLLLHAALDYAACAQICIPYHADLVLALPAGTAVPGPQAAAIARAQAEVPKSAAEAGIELRSLSVGGTAEHPALRLVVASTAARFAAPDVFVEGIDGASFGRPQVALAEGGRRAEMTVRVAGVARRALLGRHLTLTLVDGSRAAELHATAAAGAAGGADGFPFAILAAALLGGLILNVMPCVLPVLSLKLFAVVEFAGAERRRLRTGFAATALGILASFLLLAVVLVALRAGGMAIGWGIQFQQPLFLVAMIALLSLFAASLWDWLAIGLPGAVYRAGAVEARSPWASAFLTGVFATLLATPCSAPFVGTAVGFALSRGPVEIVAIFLLLGLGFALPYLAVAAFPAIVRLVPQPGRWMITVRRLLGLALAASAAWLLSVLAAESGGAAALVAGGLMAALLAALAWRSRLAFGRGRRALGAGAAALVAVALATPAMLGGRGQAEASPADAAWQPFDPAELQRLVAKGDVVFVDVSADWCLTCKVNKAAVIDRNPVAARLQRPGTVVMRADWTRPDPAIAAYLASFGRYGIPFDAVYGPGARNGIALPELLTSAAVTAALDTAQAAGPLAGRR